MTNNTTEKTYFTKEEALSDIKNTLENGYSGYGCDLHHEVFNTDYYIIGTYEAKQALTQYGVFEAIEEIQDYEKDHFGEVHTDLSNPEKIANMLYYIKGEEAIDNLLSENKDFDNAWNSTIDDETRMSIIQTIELLED